MGFEIKCPCGESTWAKEILDLLQNHTDPATGRLLCSHCGKPHGRVEQVEELQEGGTWKYWVVGAMPLASPDRYHRPYLRLVAETPDGGPSMVQFSYYKDTRDLPGGRLKHGHGPGGPTVLAEQALIKAIVLLAESGVVSRERLLRALHGDAPPDVH